MLRSFPNFIQPSLNHRDDPQFGKHWITSPSIVSKCPASQLTSKIKLPSYSFEVLSLLSSSFKGSPSGFPSEGGKEKLFDTRRITCFIAQCVCPRPAFPRIISFLSFTHRKGFYSCANTVPRLCYFYSSVLVLQVCDLRKRWATNSKVFVFSLMSFSGRFSPVLWTAPDIQWGMEEKANYNKWRFVLYF